MLLCLYVISRDNCSAEIEMYFFHASERCSESTFLFLYGILRMLAKNIYSIVCCERKVLC